eukprot:880477-Pleurochrysis_carterae.AAC.2
MKRSIADTRTRACSAAGGGGCVRACTLCKCARAYAVATSDSSLPAPRHTSNDTLRNKGAEKQST